MTCVCTHAELVWTAPELLKLRVVDVPFEGSKAGDVYSYSIILHQILCRSVPYGDDYSSSSKQSMAFFIRLVSLIISSDRNKICIFISRWSVSSYCQFSVHGIGKPVSTFIRRPH